MPRPDRLWIPVDLNYWDHPQVVEAGELAAVMYLRIIAYARRHDLDGWVPRKILAQWCRDHQERLGALVDVGLVTVGDRSVAVTDWDKWHETTHARREREERRRELDRERKRAKRSHNSVLERESESESEVRTGFRTVSARSPQRTRGGQELTGTAALMAHIAEIRAAEGDPT